MDPETALNVNRYLPAFALALLVWDHLLTIDREVSLVWTNAGENYIKRAFFFMNRYVTEGMLGYVIYATNGVAPDLDTKACRQFQWAFDAIIMAFFVLTKAAIALRIYRLWGRKQCIGAILICGLVIAGSAVVVFSLIMRLRLQFTAVSLNGSKIPNYKFCYYNTTPNVYPISFGAQAIFDLFAILLVVSNAVDRPYQRNIDVVVAVQRDGLKLFMILFALRLIVLVVAVEKYTDAISLALLPPVWALVAVVNSRLHFQISSVENPESNPESLLE